MPRNIAKPFEMQLSLVDMEPLNIRYQCFYGEDIQLIITAINENNTPMDLTNVSARVYYINGDVDLRQDANVWMSDRINGQITIAVKKGYIKTGDNEVRVLLFDDDQEVFLQPVVINCLKTKIYNDIEIPIDPDDLDFDYKSEIYRLKDENATNRQNIGSLGGLKTVAKNTLVNSVNELYDDIKTNSAQLAEIERQKANKDGIFSMANMGQDIKTAMTGGSVAVVGENTILVENIVNNQVSHIKLGNDVLKFDDVNLIYKLYDNYFVNWTDGVLTQNNEYVASDLIKVEPNTIRYCKVQTHHAFYNESKSFVSGVQGNIPGSENNIINIPSNAHYIRLSTKKTLLDKFILCKTLDFLNNYNNYSLSNLLNGKEIKLKGEWVENGNIKDGTITKEKATKSFVTHTKGKNKYYAVYKDKFVDWNYSGLIDNTSYDTSDYIDVEEGQQIYQSTYAHYCFYDENLKRVSGDRASNTPNPLIVPTNAKYLRVSPYKTDKYYMLTINDSNLTYEIGGTHLSSIKEGVPIIDIENLKEDIKKIKEDSTIKNSRFNGKKVSWYGTSITQGYEWCKLVNNYFNFNSTNNGVGGTTISLESNDSSMCTVNRIKGLYGGVYDENTGQTTYNGVAIPSDVEVIFIEGGTNDWARNWDIGDKTFSEAPNNKTFAGACHMMFKNLTQLFPNAEIIVVGAPFGKMANRNVFTNKYGVLNNNNLQTLEYGDVLLDIAGKWGVKGINMGRHMQIHDNNVANLIPDGLHLSTSESQKRASDVIINYLLNLN